MQRPVIFSGTQPGPRVLLLHGFLGHPEDWRATWEAGPQVGEWVAPWLPGHGRDPSQISMASLADEIETLSAGQPFDLCVGYSLGARCARSVERARNLWRQLLLVSHDPRPPKRMVERFTQDVQRAHDLSTLGLEAFLEHWYRLPIFRGMAPSESFLDRRRVHQPVALCEVLWRWSPGRLRLPEGSQPAGVIVGGDDPAMEDLIRTAATLDESLLHVIPEASHHLLEMAPHALAVVIQQLLEQRRSRCS
jgi:2-succinyl-6-hydroxy-2,4-cyclohexadiene-1-carboxylate synthase